MATGISKYGEDYFLRNATGGSYDILLFDDTSESGFDEASDLPLSTEPSQTGSGYARQAVTLSVEVANGSQTQLNAPTVSFASLASFAASKVVTAYGVVKSFSTPSITSGDHLVFSGSLSQPRNLADFDQLNVDNIGGELDDDGGTF